MLADDFSFPVVQTPVAHQFSVNPPSFWCVSSQSFSGYSCEGDDDDRGRRSGGCCSPREREEMKGVEEKMDTLWEDFNEELQRVCSKKEGMGGSWKSGDGEAPAVMEVCCVQALEMSRRTGGGVLSHKRHSAVMVLKVLKKMFLLHNSARLIRRRKPDRCYLNR